MIDALLIPQNTTITAKGDSEPLDLTGASARVFLATLSITRIVEQESFELSFFTSADGTTWEAKPVASLPQKFYPGQYPLLVDLSQSETAKFLRGPTAPSFEVSLRIREIPADMLQEARAEAHSRHHAD